MAELGEVAGGGQAGPAGIPFKTRVLSAWLPAALFLTWFGGLWVLSSLPGNEVDLPRVPHIDKVAHFIYFAPGGFLMAWFLRQVFAWRLAVVVLAATLAMAGIAAVDELHQLFTPKRMGADFGDWLADLLGSFTGAMGFFIWHGKISSRTTDS